MSETNVKVIESIYGAFGRGDLSGILEHVATETRWDFDVTASEVPWHEPATGHAGVGRFIHAFVSNVEVTRFEPTTFVHSGDHVIAHIQLAYTVRKTGRRVEMDQLHFWTLTDGKVSRLRHFEDTDQVKRAWSA